LIASEGRKILDKILEEASDNGEAEEPLPDPEDPPEPRSQEWQEPAPRSPSPRPPCTLRIEEIPEPPTSPAAERVSRTETNPPLVPPFSFEDELFMTFGNSSRLPKIDRRFTRASRPAFTFLGEAQRMKEDLLWLSAVINRQWLEERRLDTKAVKLYPQPGLIPGRVSMLPLQDILYDPRVGVNIIPQQIVEQHFSTIPLSKANIRLRWMDGTFLKSRGVLRVVPVT